jgi:hypothetical protein
LLHAFKSLYFGTGRGAGKVAIYIYIYIYIYISRKSLLLHSFFSVTLEKFFGYETLDCLQENLRFDVLEIHCKDQYLQGMQVRFDVYKAVTTNNVFFWDMKSQFLHHRRHIVSPLQSLAG